MEIKDYLTQLKEEGNLRKIPDDFRDNLLDFTSNDYMGLASDKSLVQEFLMQESDLRFSSSASRLLASRQNEYSELENLIKDEYNRDALVLNSGYHANTGIIPALASDSKTLIIADKLVHASIIDGIILSRAEFRRFPHNDIKALKKIVEKNYGDYERIIVITESVFSMDGDSPDLESILDIKKEFPKLILYLDEAHALGIEGPRGKGLSQATSTPGAWDILVFPLGKAAASMGAFVVCSPEMKDFLVNKSRSFIFSTALPPVQIKWTSFILRKLFGMEGRREHLKILSSHFSECIRERFNNQPNSISHIQPLIIGDPNKTIELSQFFLENGIKVLPIRKPTVAVGTERLRFSLTANMTKEDILKVREVLRNIDATKIYNR